LHKHDEDDEQRYEDMDREQKGDEQRKHGAGNMGQPAGVVQCGLMERPAGRSPLNLLFNLNMNLLECSGVVRHRKDQVQVQVYVQAGGRQAAPP
jgi:hypothetical protein